jgi:hypothetical protein
MRARLIGLALALVSALALATGAAAAPPPPAPEHPRGAPPPAWIETSRAERWLAYSSYCWTSPTRGLCADYVDPFRRTDLPRFGVTKGEVVRIQLGFVPTEAYVTIGKRTVRPEPSRILEVRVRSSGVLVVHVYGPRGDAGYVGRLVARAPA